MSVLLKAKGLKTFANQLGGIPEGSLLEATNIVIDRDGIVQPRRGFNLYGTELTANEDRVSQLLVYKDRILRHFDDVLQFDNGSGTFAAFSGSYTVPDSSIRMKGAEANGNFYFTTDEGIKKISASAASTLSSTTIVSAGGVKALDLQLAINYDVAGFMDESSKVAYRVVWGINDVNDNLILGTPSSRTVITNISTTLLANVDLSFSVPAEVTSTDYFYQIYRTAVKPKGALTLDEIDPGDEMNLVYEASVTTAQITAQTVSVTDITPDDFRVGGTPLYTNPTSGDGILQANDKPPLSKDIANFKDHTFYANTSTYHRFEFNILGLNSFVSGTSKFIITNGTSKREYTFVGQTEIATILCDTKANTASGSYILVSSASNERRYFFWFDKTGSDVEPSASDTVGRIGVQVNITTDTTAIEVATRLATAIEGTTDFTCSAGGTATATITWIKNGNVTNTAFGSVAPGGAYTVTTTQEGDGEAANTVDGGDVLLSSLVTPSQAVDETARSLVRIINNDTSGLVYAFYLSGPDDLPGNILLEKRDLTDETFYLGLNESAITQRFNPTIPVRFTGTASVASPSVITAASHGLTSGDTIVIYDSTTTPTLDGSHVATVLTANTFSVPVNVTVGGNVSFFKASALSSNERSGNRVYFSKPQQPEAVPIVNFFPVGGKDKAIKRIKALRDSLFIFKEDAIYRVTGYNGQFSPELFDSSATIIAPDTIDVLNNQIYVLTSQGVATVSDGGVGIVSRDIENEITKLTQFDDFASLSFAVSYEIDRAYLLWLPKKSSDTSATQCFRYNVFTQCWTRWDKAATCGVVNSVIYIGADDTNYIEKERKSFTIDDFADRELDLSVLLNRVDDNEYALGSVDESEVGDVLSQTQYLTISQFNRLLTKLDSDPSIVDTDFSSTLALLPGQDMRANITALAVKLDADAGVALTNYASSLVGLTTFIGMQSDFNIIVNKLNSDNGVKFSDYRTSTGTLVYRSPITLVRSNGNILNTLAALPLISGPVKVVKAIVSTTVWAPAHFGQPEILKQVSEGTILFERTTFTSGIVSYKTDLSQAYENIAFSESGTGEFGTFGFGEVNFGGDGSEVPIRTFIPRNKQRCRYITVKFTHRTALETYAILGISFKERAISTRAYR